MSQIKYAFFALLLLWSVSGYSQAWVRPKGDAFIYAGFSHTSSDKKYEVTQTEIELNRLLTDQTLNIYGEYGLSEKLTLNINLPIKHVATSEQINENGTFADTLDAGSLIGLSNISTALVYRLSPANKSYSLTFQSKTYIPTVSQKADFGLQTGYKAWGWENSLHLGLGLSKGYWLASSIGINTRSTNYSEQLTSYAELGKKIKKSYLIFRYEGLEPLKKDILPGETNYLQTGLYTNHVAYQSFTLKYGYNYKESSEENSSSSSALWVAFGGGFYGQDVLRAPSLSLGVSTQF